MPLPLALIGTLGIAGGHLAKMGVTSSGVRSFGGQFVQSLPFGAGYSLGTYLGFPKNYQSNQSFNNRIRTVNLDTMPGMYSYYNRRRYSGRRYGRRYGRRSYRRYYRRYRRYY